MNMKSDTMAMKGTYSDGKGKRTDYLVELHGAMQAVHIKNIPEFEKSKIVYEELEAEQFKIAESLLNEAKAYNSLRNMWDDIDRTEKQLYKRSEILGLRK